MCAFVIQAPTHFAQSKQIIVVRHGEARQNVLKILNGNAENSKKYSLTNKGREQATRTALRLRSELGLTEKRVEKVYVSPLHRTLETARILMQILGIPNEKMVINEALREVDMGSLEEQPESAAEMFSPTGSTWDLSNAKAYGGENGDDLSARISNFIRQITHENPDQYVLLVTHGSPSKEILSRFEQDGQEAPQLQHAEYRMLELSNFRPWKKADGCIVR